MERPDKILKTIAATDLEAGSTTTEVDKNN
jgi:hypothetical protein